MTLKFEPRRQTNSYGRLIQSPAPLYTTTRRLAPPGAPAASSETNSGYTERDSRSCLTPGSLMAEALPPVGAKL
jgi:hypothetical protein